MELLYVPDASVILKWALQTGETKEQDRALDLLHLWLEGGCEFALPQLWLYEVGNVLARKNPQRSAELMELLVGFRFNEVRVTAELCRETLEMMARYSASFYDTVYHAVAQRCGGTLITTDASYYRKAREAGRIMLLKDFEAQ